MKNLLFVLVFIVGCVIMFCTAAHADKITDVEGLWRGKQSQLIHITMNDEGVTQISYDDANHNRSIYFSGEMGFDGDETTVRGTSEKSLRVEIKNKVCTVSNPEINLEGVVKVNGEYHTYKILQGSVHGKAKCQDGTEVLWGLDLSGLWNKY